MNWRLFKKNARCFLSASFFPPLYAINLIIGILYAVVWALQKVDPQTAEAIDQFLLKLKACATGVSPFTFVLDDPAGNSFIENP